MPTPCRVLHMTTLFLACVGAALAADGEGKPPPRPNPGAWSDPFGTIGPKVKQAGPAGKHFSQAWRIAVPFPAGTRYRVRMQHAAPGNEGAFRIWAWADTDEDGIPDLQIGTSRVLRGKRASDWSAWEFVSQHTRVFVGNWYPPGTITFYRSGGSMYTGLKGTLFYARSVGGAPTTRTDGPRFTNIIIQVKVPPKEEKQKDRDAPKSGIGLPE